MTDEVREQAFAMFAEGKSVNAVAGALFKGFWTAAKKAKTEWESQGGASTVIAPTRKKKAKKRREAAANDEPDESGPEQFQLQIDVPTDQLDGVLQRLTAQEKANAVQFIIQQRMDAMLAGD